MKTLASALFTAAFASTLCLSSVAHAQDAPVCRTVVENTVKEHLGAADFTMSSTLEEIGADDLDIVELTMAFEEELGIEIPDEDAETAFSGRLSDVVSYLQKRGACR